LILMNESTVESSTGVSVRLTEKRPIRVLHVDDDPGFLKVAKQCFEMQGRLQVDTARSAEGAMEKMKQEAYDVIVVDYQMLGKNGLEFLKELREKGNGTPFIIFTGKSRKEVAIKALNLGADGYVNKHGEPETVYDELAHGIRQAVERKKAEMKMRVKEERLRAVFSSSPDAIAVSDLQGNILDCNEAAWKMLGFSSKEEVIGKSSFDFFAKKGRQKALENLKKTLEQGTVRNLEYALLNKDGDELWGELSASIIKDSLGNPLGFVGIMRDTTARKQVEEEKSRLLHDLHERAKELNCLYGMSRIFEKSDISLDDALQKTADLLPPAMQYPDIACARIVIENREFSTKNFKETRWKMQADIKLLGKKAGSVEACYLEERPTIAEDPFPKEERFLIDAIAERLGKITERKKAEQALRESEKKYRELVEVLNEGIWVIDKDAYTTFVNPRMAEMLGYTVDEMQGKHLFSFMDEKGVEIAKHLLGRRKQSIEEQHNFEFVRKDGKRIYAILETTSLTDENGNYRGSIAGVTDVTERRKTEKAFRESEEKLRNVFAASPDAITVADLNGIIVDCNQATVDLHGYQSREGLIGKNSLELIAKKDHEQAMQSLKKTLEQGAAKNIEYTFLTKDGREFPAELSASAVRDASGKLEYFVAITKDITKRKNMEKQLKEYSEHLEEKVEEKTNQLKKAQEQLLKAERFAAIGEAAAMVGHDLRNPLQVITNMVYTSEKKSKSIPITDREIIEKHGFLDLRSGLKEQVKYMEKIVADLQYYAKPIKPTPVEIDLHKPINKTLSSLTVPENVKVSIVIPEDFPKLMLDPTLMQRVFSNLIINAVQTMPNGGKLTIRASRKEETALISIEDTGAGIPDENLSKLFTPLFTTKAKGQGFGLPVCKRLVEAHDGNITVKSKVGKGSTFTVEIPLRKEVSYN